jgi:MerR family copper efflux transcriptional regulator
MKIKNLAEKTGLTAPTIRFYEKEGLLDSRHVRRENNNYRDYNEETVDQLLLIRQLQAAGFTITELRVMTQAGGLDEFSLPKKIVFLRQKMKEIDEKKAELEQIQNLLSKMLANKMALLESKC